jgi:hypothetical protein
MVKKVVVSGVMADFFLACKEDFESMKEAMYRQAVDAMIKEHPAEILRASPTYAAIFLVDKVKFKASGSWLVWLGSEVVPPITELVKHICVSKDMQTLLKKIYRELYGDARVILSKAVLAEFIRQNRSQVVIRPTVEGVGDLYGDARLRAMKIVRDADDDPGVAFFDNPCDELFEEEN